ncbi:hypothetical protein LF1_00050 [Rubripirellula obstinata]|uniref:Uncharacterized protein n=1 Tax=Rubripirellula obstinata TaxID=406547 RepID=A0A5B1C8Q5_9BACT|nr:hypothetical protein LF1_00050 [Rubripirellula obstinata]
MHTVIRPSRGHLLPASRPAGHNQRTTNTALPPTLDQHPSADCPAGHQPTPESQCSINADVPDALRGTTNACLRLLDLTLPTQTCLTDRSLLRSTNGDCHPRGRSPRRRHRNGALRITIACTGVAAARFSLCLHVKSRHLGDAYRYPTACCLARSSATWRSLGRVLGTANQWLCLLM